MRSTRNRMITAVMATGMAIVALTACTEDSSSQSKERDTQQSNYDQLVANQPAGTMNFSPTRETINMWIETWGEPGKLAYVYLVSGDGDPIGYYVLEGLPVSYCASLTPTYRIEGDSAGNVLAPSPAMDGVYYSGGQCNTYYGKDATTGTYLEWTAGMGVNTLLYEAPMPWPDMEPLGQTSVEDVE